MNKFDYINKVLTSSMKPEDKCLLIELIMRANENWECWPSVERLCKARGIKHEKNFKGADVYLPGIVSKSKQGRRNFYRINTPALEGLLDAEVLIKHTNTPAVEGAYTPAVADNTPAVADNTPAVEGANSTGNNSVDTTDESSSSDDQKDKEEQMMKPLVPSLEGGAERHHNGNTPAVEGVLKQSNAPTGNTALLDAWAEEELALTGPSHAEW